MQARAAAARAEKQETAMTLLTQKILKREARELLTTTGLSLEAVAAQHAARSHRARMLARGQLARARKPRPLDVATRPSYNRNH